MQEYLLYHTLFVNEFAEFHLLNHLRPDGDPMGFAKKQE